MLEPSAIVSACEAVLAMLLGAAPAGDCSRSGPDIIAGDIVSPANYAAAGGFEALSFGTVACNVGDAEISMIAMTNEHTVLGQSLYRLSVVDGATRFEQVGTSWLRHGFLALSSSLCCTCTPTDGTALGIGCSDPNSAGRNGSQAILGPRWQVNAHTGFFPYPAASPPYSGSTARRLQVSIGDLEPTGGSSTTRYFGEVHYVSADDSAANNQHNNASYREALVTGSGSAWSFAVTGSTQREASAIRAWRAADAGVTEIDVELPGGELLVLASNVTSLGATWRYEYALYNMHSDDGVRSFSVPLPDGVSVTNVGFHDVEHRDGDGIGNVAQDGTDWAATVAGGAITWASATFAENPNGNALRWGTTYSFRFDADRPPRTADVELGLFRSGGSHVVPGARGPSPVGGSVVLFCTDSDGSSSLCPCANAGAAGSGCDNAQGTGGVTLSVVGQTTSPNGATLQGSGFSTMGAPTALVIRSNALDPSSPVVFGDGLRCINTSPLVRLATSTAVGGVSTHVFGHGPAAGSGTFYYQLWYRNTPASYCTPAAFNLSSGRTLSW